MLVYLVGNRCDLGDGELRQVTVEDGIELMKDMELDHHMETSALSGHNIEALFETLTKHLYLENNKSLGEFRETVVDHRASSISFRNDNNKLNNSRVNLYQQRPKKKKKGCCKG